ncbi:MAG: class I SAM-dependent methyltransferase, partial [Dongiaceae bacterium]
MLFATALRRFIRTGSLRLIDADGRGHVFGDGGTPRSAIRLHDRRLHTRLALDPGLSVGEAYMDGTLTVEEGTLYDFLDLAARNFDNLGRHPLWAIARRLGQGLRQRNPHARARANVAHH